MPTQEEIFLEKEGDNWFKRNKEVLCVENKTNDYPIGLLQQNNVRPKRVLEIGCSNGWRLEILRQKYNCQCVGIEPSISAIAHGRKRYPKIIFKRGTASALPYNKEPFDLVIVNFVFHWISRELLLKSVSEIDWVVADGGFLIISDFLPDIPRRNIYHHLPGKGVFTFKLDYSKIFVASGLYQEVAKLTFDHDNHTQNSKVDSDRRGGCFLLRKSLKNFYLS